MKQYYTDQILSNITKLKPSQKYNELFELFNKSQANKNEIQASKQLKFILNQVNKLLDEQNEKGVN